MRLVYWLLVIGLTFSLYAEWMLSPIRPPILPDNKPKAVTQHQDLSSSLLSPFVFPLHARESYNIIAQRNLFTPSRRPEEPESQPSLPVAAANVVEEPNFGGLVLKAVFINGNKRTALIQDPQINKILHLTKGEKVKEWSIKTIQPEYIEMLSANGTVSKLELRVFKPVIPNTATTAAINEQQQAILHNPNNPNILRLQGLRRPLRPIPRRFSHP